MSDTMDWKPFVDTLSNKIKKEKSQRDAEEVESCSRIVLECSSVCVPSLASFGQSTV